MPPHLHADACYPHRRGSRSPSEVHEHPRMDPCQGNAEAMDATKADEATRCTRRPRRERCMPYLSAAPPIDVNPMDDAR